MIGHKRTYGHFIDLWEDDFSYGKAASYFEMNQKVVIPVFKTSLCSLSD